MIKRLLKRWARHLARRRGNFNKMATLVEGFCKRFSDRSSTLLISTSGKLPLPRRAPHCYGVRCFCSRVWGRCFWQRFPGCAWTHIAFQVRFLLPVCSYSKTGIFLSMRPNWEPRHAVCIRGFFYWLDDRAYSGYLFYQHLLKRLNI